MESRKMDIQIYPLTGNAYAIKEYARTISGMSSSASNAYVMAFDNDNECLWCIQAGSDKEDLKAMNMKGVKRIEIYDHGCIGEGMYKMEQVYANSQKYLDKYFDELKNVGEIYEISENSTSLKAI